MRPRVGPLDTADRGTTHLVYSKRAPMSVWSPIAASRTWEGARRTAAGLLVFREDTFGNSADERSWKPAAARCLAPLLLAAAHDARSMGERPALDRPHREDEVRAALAACADEAAGVARPSGRGFDVVDQEHDS